MGLLFLEASLRTRVGFAAAAARLGGQSIEIADRRASEVAMPEAWTDTLRVVSGNVDLVIARACRPLDGIPLKELLVSSFINGGDTALPASIRPRPSSTCMRSSRRAGRCRS